MLSSEQPRNSKKVLVAWHATCTLLFPKQRRDGQRPGSPRELPKKEKGETTMKKTLKVRGASMVEYALLLVAVLLLAAAAYKALGPKVSQAATSAGNQLN